MTRTMASFAAHYSDPPALSHQCNIEHYVSLVRTSNFENTTINQRGIEFLVGHHGARDDGKSVHFDPKEMLICKYRNFIITSDICLVDCCVDSAHEGPQGPKMPPT